MAQTQNYTFFYSGPFSQWYPSKFKDAANEYYNAEQYMMYMKAIFFKDHETAKQILETKNPKICKKLGRQVANFNQTNWDKVCQNIVFYGNMYKFKQNDHLCNILKSTKHTTLIGCSPIDKIWGIGRSLKDPLISDEKNWLGKNFLGNILTIIRMKMFGE